MTTAIITALKAHECKETHNILVNVKYLQRYPELDAYVKSMAKNPKLFYCQENNFVAIRVYPQQIEHDDLYTIIENSDIGNYPIYFLNYHHSEFSFKYIGVTHKAGFVDRREAITLAAMREFAKQYTDDLYLTEYDLNKFTDEHRVIVKMADGRVLLSPKHWTNNFDDYTEINPDDILKPENVNSFVFQQTSVDHPIIMFIKPDDVIYHKEAGISK